MKKLSWLVPTLYILFLMLPIYWLINMSFKTNREITSVFTLFPRDFTLANYAVIFTAQRTEGDNGYNAMAVRMDELAAHLSRRYRVVTFDPLVPGSYSVPWPMLHLSNDYLSFVPGTGPV